MLNQALKQIPDLTDNTIECCRQAGIDTLDDLFAFVGTNSLTEIKDCTPETVNQLLNVIYRYENQRVGYQYDLFSVTYDDDPVEDGLSEAELFMRRITSDDYRAIVDRAFDEVANGCDPIVKTVYADASSLLFAISREPHSLLIYNNLWSVKDNLALWDFGYASLMLMRERLGKDSISSLSSLIKNTIDYLDDNLKLTKFRSVYSHLTPLEADVVTGEYHAIFDQLSVRAKNAINNSKLTLDDIITVALTGDASLLHLKNVGVNTVKEIQTVFLSYYDIVINIINRPKESLDRTILSRSLPFIGADDVAWVAQCRPLLQHLPMMYIIHAYFKHASDRSDRVFAMINGIAGEVMTRQQVAKAVGLSLERVRQILLNYKLPKPLQKLLEAEIVNYQDFNVDFLCRDALTHVAECEFPPEMAAECSDNGLFAIIKLMFGGEVVTFRNNVYYVSDHLMRGFDIKNALKSVDDVFSAKRASDLACPVANFVTPCLKPVPDAISSTRLAEIMTEIVSETLSVPLMETPCFMLRQNIVVMEQEIYDLIARKGAPMTLKDIQAALTEKFPFKDFSRTESVRSYLIRSDRIKAIGKTSTYGLADWDINTLTVRDQIFEIISASDRPLSINEINEQLKLKGMARSWTNVYATIFTDVKRGYARFNKSLFGLADRQYPAEYTKVPMKVKDAAK